jgi:hypothetical protein
MARRGGINGVSNYIYRGYRFIFIGVILSGNFVTG